MKLKLYLVSIILLASQYVFSLQHRDEPVLKSSADYSGTFVNNYVVYYRCYCVTANPNSSKPIPTFVTTNFKTPAANVSTYNSQQQYNNIVRIQNPGSNAVIILSNPVNYNTGLSSKNLRKQEVKAGIIYPARGSGFEMTNKTDFDNYNEDAFIAAANILFSKSTLKPKATNFLYDKFMTENCV